MPQSVSCCLYLVVKGFVATGKIGDEVLTIADADFCVLLGQRLNRRDIQSFVSIKRNVSEITEADTITSDGADRPMIVSSELSARSYIDPCQNRRHLLSI